MSNKHIDYNKLIRYQPAQEYDKRQKIGILIISLLFIGLLIYTALTLSNKPQSILTPEINTENQTTW